MNITIELTQQDIELAISQYIEEKNPWSKEGKIITVHLESKGPDDGASITATATVEDGF